MLDLIWIKPGHKPKGVTMDTEKLAYQAFRRKLQRALDIGTSLLLFAGHEHPSGDVLYLMRRQRAGEIETFSTYDVEAALETACAWGYDCAGYSSNRRRTAHGT